MSRPPSFLSAPVSLLLRQHLLPKADMLQGLLTKPVGASKLLKKPRSFVCLSKRLECWPRASSVRVLYRKESYFKHFSSFCQYKYWSKRPWNVAHPTQTLMLLCDNLPNVAEGEWIHPPSIQTRGPINFPKGCFNSHLRQKHTGVQKVSFVWLSLRRALCFLGPVWLLRVKPSILSVLIWCLPGRLHKQLTLSLGYFPIRLLVLF